MKLALAPSLCLMLLILIAGGASGKNILDEALAGRRDGRELKGAGPPKVSKRKCTTLRIKQPMNELLGNRFPPINLAPGFYAWAISRAPFYDDITGKKLGEYSETTFKFNSTIPSNCIVDAAFDFLPSTDGFFLSSLNAQYTCTAETNAIVGGTGDYKCATGHQDFIAFEKEYVTSNLVFCYGGCP